MQTTQSPSSPNGKPGPSRRRAGLHFFRTLCGANYRCVVDALDWLVVVVGLWFAMSVLRVMVGRIGYPFELEWMEGAVLDHVRILASSQPLYRQPSLEFTPYIYPPGYYAATWLVGLVTPSLMLAGRLVSAASIAIATLLLASGVRKEGGTWWHVSFAVSWWLASYTLLGGWFELVRVDSLFLVLWLGSLWIARFSTGKLTGLWTGLLLLAAMFTKQTVLPMTVVPIGYLLLSRRRQGLIAAAVFFIGLFVGVSWADRATDGWFFYYVFGLPSQHGILWNKWNDLAIQFFWTPVAFMWLFSILLVVIPRPSRTNIHPAWFYVPLVVVAAIDSYLGLLHQDGFVNVLMPAFVALAWAGSVGLVRLDRICPRWHRFGKRVRSVSRVLALVALVVVYRSPAWLRPSPKDAPAVKRIVESLRGLPGPVLMLDTGYYASLAGHPEINAHAMALADVFKSRDVPRKTKLLDETLQVLRSRKYARVVTGRGWELLPKRIRQELERNYRKSQTIVAPAWRRYGWTKSGFISRPIDIWTPRHERLRK